MQACFENPALPGLEPNARPLLEPMPAWTIRVARPADPDRDVLAQELRDVPKAALRHIFGKAFGTILWQQNRLPSTTAKPAPGGAISQFPPISDGEISGGLLRYLCAEAAATLRERNRLAKSISLTVSYPDGASDTVREPLQLASSDAMALESAARLALRRARSRAFVSVELDLTATPAWA
ncbi:MAG: hypothetical protein JO260_05955 [Acidobacteria bacterium]|nr:hypothetical protein [Acidobacteriota bacterium]